MAVALVAAVVVPAGSARSGARVELSVLPLPASLLGSAAGSLPLQRDSGVISNKDYLARALPVTPNRWFFDASLSPVTPGRVSGYALDYGHGASGAAGVAEVWTSVGAYKTSADAKKGVASWRRWETNRLLASRFRGVFSVAVTKEEAAALGSGRFAVLVAYSAANIAPLFGLDEQFSEGRYEADVTVWAGSATVAKRLAPRLAKRLDARIKQALDGRLHTKPVKLPPRPTAGPSLGGPNLASLALKTTDLTGQATMVVHGYLRPLFPLSFYNVFVSPAGQFSQLQEQIYWYPTANEASFSADADVGLLGRDSLDLSSIGDGARGFVDNGTTGGEAVLVFASGQLEEYIYLFSKHAIQPSQVESIAQTVANYINQAGLGS